MTVQVKHFLQMHFVLMHSANTILTFTPVSNPICFTELISYKGT